MTHTNSDAIVELCTNRALFNVLRNKTAVADKSYRIVERELGQNREEGEIKQNQETDDAENRSLNE